MADTQTTVAINLGSQRISMAVFETSKSGGLILKGYESDTIIADPSFEASREAQVRVVLDDLIEKLGVPKAKVRYAISGQSVFTRFVKLPPLKEDNIEQLVTFEAQQHVPFPISEVVWDYEMIKGGDDKEVVIVAIKGDALDEINDTIIGAGLSTVEVDVAPMALYNAYTETYGRPDEPTLIIDIGAKTSNLLFVEGDRFFTRSVAIGGASISSAIAKEYNISFPDAEYQKITNGLVALGGGHTETMDESLAALAMVIRNALSRLPAEIARTTNYYRSQHAGSSPRKILLAGGGANLPYTLEFFAEKLALPIEFFNPLGKVIVAKGVDTETLQREAHTMGELIGLGLRGIGKSTINIDLVPSAVELSREAERRRPFHIATAALLIAGFAGMAIMQSLAAGKGEDRVRTMKDTEENLVPIEKQIRGLLKKEQELTHVAKAYTETGANHAFWIDLIGELRGAFASDSVWLTEMTPLYGYNPIPPTGPNPVKPVATPVVKADFANPKTRGSSIIEPPKTNQPPPGRNQPAAPAAGANAILVKGFWRENPRSQNIVSDLLKRLRDNSELFSFSAKDARGKDVTLSDEQILKAISAGASTEGDLAFPFELVLPLSRQVSVK